MKGNRYSICAFVLVIFLFSLPDRIQAQAKTPFEQVRACFDSADAKFTSDDAKNLIGFARDDFNSLHHKWTSGGSKPLPEDYVNGLKNYCNLIAEAALGNKNNTERRKILTYVKLDVNAKLVASNVSGITETMNSKITITVRTFRNGVEVSGYVVKCNPTPYGVTKVAKYPFSAHSGPNARAFVPPGRYIVWAEDADGNVVERSHEVSIIGGSETNITLMLN